MSTKPILLVEDNPDDQQLAIRAFRKSSFTNVVVIASDGVEAMDYLLGTGQYEGSDPDLPAVVLLDLKLPRLDGLGVLKAIRAHERTKYLPVVVVTSSKEDQDIIRSYDLGANSYVRKPVDFKEFVDVISHLGRYWLRLNESAIT